MNDRYRKGLGKVLMTIAAVLFFLSGLCLLGGVLGLVGVLADVSKAENQQMGHQLLRMAMYPLVAGVPVLLVAFVVLRARPT